MKEGNRQFRQRFRGLRPCRPNPSGESGFRPILADSAVITAINNGEIKPGDFVWAGRACALSAAGRKKMIAAFERRLALAITHPVFGYRVSYRRALEIQGSLLGRHLMGEIPDLPPLEPR